MYLYAFDLSMECTGLVIFELETHKPILITSFPTKKSWTHGKRLNQIYEGIKKFAKDYPVEVVAIERGFSRFNTATQVIFRVHGCINFWFHKHKQVYYPPKSVKEAILTGSATKKAVQNKIKVMYPDIEFQNEDESDAFAVGLTYLIKECGMVWEKSSRKKKKEVTTDKPKRTYKKKVE